MINCLYASTEALRPVCGQTDSIVRPSIRSKWRRLFVSTVRLCRKAVAPDEQVEVADEIAFRAEPSPLPAKDPAGLHIYLDQLDAFKEGIQFSLALFWIRISLDTVIEFTQRDHAETDPFRRQLGNAIDNTRDLVHVVNHPVRIDEVLHGATERAVRASL